MRLTTLIQWTPENAEAIYKRFEAFRDGDAPAKVKQAFNKITFIAWEKLSTNRVLTIVEGDPSDLAIWNSYWQNLADFEVLEPSYDMKDEAALSKILPPAYML